MNRTKLSQLDCHNKVESESERAREISGIATSASVFRR